MWKCPNCDTNNEDQNLFCSCCGRKKPEQQNTVVGRQRQAPKTLNELYNEGLERKKRGDLSGAEELLLKALELDQHNARVMTALGATFSARGAKALAEILYKRAIDLDPQYPYAWNNYAVLLSDKGDDRGANTMVEKCLSLITDSHPLAGLANFNHGVYLAWLGERAAAAEAWRKAERVGYDLGEINEQRRKYGIQ